MRKIINTVLAFASILLIVLGYMELLKFHKVEQQSDEIRTMAIEVPKTDDTEVTSPYDWKINFEELQAVNPDIKGWIYIPGTNINYPILSGDYLTRDMYGNYSWMGSVFAYPNVDLREDIAVRMYAHNVISKQMFGNVADYRNPDYASTHTKMYIYTPERTKECTLISTFGCRFDDEVFKVSPEDANEHAEYLKNRSELALELPEKNRQIFTLGTCVGYNGTPYRYTTSFTVTREKFVL